MQQVFIEGGLIRKLWDVEAPAYRDHLLRLDAESRRNRFCGGIADDTIRSYAVAARGGDVILHGFFVDGVLRGVADLRIVRPLDRREAEAAFSIEKPWQSRGIGSALLERTRLAARNRYIKHLHVSCLPQNRRMQKLARKFGAEITFDYDTVIGTMENANPTPLSLMQELAADSHSLAAAYIDFQSRVLRPVAALPMPLPYRAALQVH
jgi:RimJ/RimL family protein N-acetyltransferase